MKQRKFEAVLFDLDGTVLDTTEFIYQAYKYVIKLYLKKNISFKKVAKVVGLPLAECYQILTGLQEVDRLCKCHDEFQNENMHLVDLYPNALKTLQQLFKAKIAMGIITTRYVHIHKSLEQVGLTRYFKVVITPKEVKEVKPHPKPLITALEYLSIKPDQAVMIGDSPVDIMAGKNAKVKTIGALYGFHGKRLLKTKPDFLITDISQILPIVLNI